MSISQSAERIISSSCSTTMTVLPWSRSSLSTWISWSVSRLCRPIEGSSRIYIEPTRAEPNEVAKLIRCDSPPDNELERRSKVRYESPTSCRKCNRFLISVSSRLAMRASLSESFRSSNHWIRSLTDMRTTSEIDLPPTFTYSASFFSLEPWHSGQRVLPR